MRPNFGVRNTTFENLFLSSRTLPYFETLFANWRFRISVLPTRPPTATHSPAQQRVREWEGGQLPPSPLAGSDTDKKHTFACKMHTIKLIAKLTSTETCRRNNFHVLRHISFNFCFNSPPWTPTHPTSHPPTNKTTKESMRCCNARAVGMARRGE